MKQFDSYEEGLAICGIALAFGLNINDIINGRDVGHKYGRWDWGFVFSFGTLLFDYDGGYWHKDTRLDKDTQKSLDAVKKKNVIVIRVRVNAIPLSIDHERIHIFDIKKCDPEIIAKKVWNIVKKYDETLRNNKIENSAENTMHELQKQIDVEYNRTFIRLELLSHGDKIWISKIMSFHGVLSRFSYYVDGLAKLKDDWGMTKNDLTKFMCNSVAAKIDSPALWDGLAKLKDDWGMTKNDLTKFMCNSVAAKIDSPALWDGLDKLKSVLGIQYLSIIMNNSIASRISSKSFVDVIIKMSEKNLMKEKYLKKFLISPYVCDENALHGLYSQIIDLNDKELIEYMTEFSGRSCSWHKYKMNSLSSNNVFAVYIFGERISVIFLCTCFIYYQSYTFHLRID